MAIEQKETYDNFDRVYRSPVRNRITRADLPAFDAKVKTYERDQQINYPVQMTVKVIDLKKYLIDCKAAGRNGIIVKNLKIGVWKNDKLVSPTDCEAITYEQAMEDLEQLFRYRQYMRRGEKSRIAQYYEMSKQLSGKIGSTHQRISN